MQDEQTTPSTEETPVEETVETSAAAAEEVKTEEAAN